MLSLVCQDGDCTASKTPETDLDMDSDKDMTRHDVVTSDTGTSLDMPENLGLRHGQISDTRVHSSLISIENHDGDLCSGKCPYLSCRLLNNHAYCFTDISQPVVTNQFDARRMKSNGKSPSTSILFLILSIVMK